ncbi:MAG: hypothetical protein ACFFD4_02070 [Candidatus Odinarchaeota archaeon]
MNSSVNSDPLVDKMKVLKYPFNKNFINIGAFSVKIRVEMERRIKQPDTAPVREMLDITGIKGFDVNHAKH